MLHYCMVLLPGACSTLTKSVLKKQNFNQPDDYIVEVLRADRHEVKTTLATLKVQERIIYFNSFYNENFDCP